MSKPQDYKRAYERQRQARERAEDLLESRSRELYDSHATLVTAFEKLNSQKSHMVQQEKLASIGMLAAGIAHEINNPVGFIKSNLETLVDYLQLVNDLFDSFQSAAKRIDDDPESVDYRHELTELVNLARSNDLAYVIKDSLASIQESLEGTQRVKEIISNLRDFSRKGSDNREQCSLNEVIDSTLMLLRNEVKHRINIVKEYAELPLFYACVSQLNQVFLNIMLNASQAMGDKGAITIRTYAKEPMLCVDFIDTGPGIDEDNLPKVFDPFFTTKDVGAGTGLGLYISHGLIKKHRGDITVQNEPGGGTRFTVSLPINMRALPRDSD